MIFSFPRNRNWLYQVANIGHQLAMEYRSRYRVISEKKDQMRKDLFQQNMPKTYQEQLSIDARVVELSLPFYQELLTWMESQLSIAQQDAEFFPQWQNAIEETKKSNQLRQQELESLSASYNANEHNIDDVLEWAVDTNIDIKPILDEYGIDYYDVEFPLKTVLRFDIGDKSWVYEDGGLTEAEEWINNAEPYEYFEPEPDDEFWKHPLQGFKVYHATPEKNAHIILREGIGERDATRGIANRYTGAAVFTSDNPHDVDVYGEVVFEIDVGAMQADGYMPQVTKEEPIEEQELKGNLAHMLDIDDYYWDVDTDISPTTLIFFGEIPPKYIRLYE